MQTDLCPLLHSSGRALSAVSQSFDRARPSVSPQSLDAMPHQWGLVCDLPAVTVPAGQQQQQQADEDQGADCHQGVGDHPHDGLLQHAAGAVCCHVCCWEGPSDLWERLSVTHCKQRRDSSEAGNPTITKTIANLWLQPMIILVINYSVTKIIGIIWRSFI